MRVFKAEAGEENLGITIRHIIIVAIGIKQQIRRVQHKDSAAAFHGCSGYIQAFEESLVLVVNTIAISVLVDTDFIGPDEMMGRWRRDFVINRAPITVMAQWLEAGGRGILEIFDHPQPATLVEVDEDRLANQGFGEDLLELEVMRCCEGSGRYLRRQGMILGLGPECRR